MLGGVLESENGIVPKGAMWNTGRRRMGHSRPNHQKRQCRRWVQPAVHQLCTIKENLINLIGMGSKSVLLHCDICCCDQPTGKLVYMNHVPKLEYILIVWLINYWPLQSKKKMIHRLAFGQALFRLSNPLKYYGIFDEFIWPSYLIIGRIIARRWFPALNLNLNDIWKYR